jgi:O-antigen ligase
MSENEGHAVEKFPSRYYSVIEKTATLLLLAYPALMLVVRGGMNGVFLLLLLLAVAVWAVRPDGMAALAWRRDWTLYVAAMAGMSLAIFFSQAYHGNFTAHPHDAASRYWLAIPVFLLLQRLRPAVFTVLQIAFPAAAILGFALAKDPGSWADHRASIETMDLIHFGDFELMLGVLSLASINWFGRDTLALRILKIAGFAAGLAASFGSGSRGGWLAIPVFAVLLLYFKSTRPTIKSVVYAMTGFAVAVVLLYSFNDTFQNRFNQLASDVASFKEGKRDTSTGVRLQLYKAAVDVFISHPVFGVGPEGFAQEMKPMMEAGNLTPIAAELGHAEVHNEVLSKAAGMGIFGLLAILAIYVVPFWLFWLAGKSARREVRRAGVQGLVFVSGFFIFGLTVEVLDLTMAAAFYSFTVAVLLAACYNIHYSEFIHPNKDNLHV